ncbi:hypothetical protein BH24BAC1_BH24BAC1_11110 [soil metagenome]
MMENVMMEKRKYLLLFLCWFLFTGCDRSEDDPTPTQTFSFTFDADLEGWVNGFSDYSADWDKDRFHFEFQHAPLPGEVNQAGKALMLSGRNISDDLFMFIKRQITGLRPNHPYQVTFLVELASRYPEESVGIGGSPGGSVYLKAGASAIEPQSVVEDGYYVMNIDKGNQSKGGEDAVVLGTVGIPGEEFAYQLIQRDNLQEPLQARTDAAGNLWLIIGTDSGFEGTSTLYYNRIEVTLQE